MRRSASARSRSPIVSSAVGATARASPWSAVESSGSAASAPSVEARRETRAEASARPVVAGGGVGLVAVEGDEAAPPAVCAPPRRSAGPSQEGGVERDVDQRET